MIKFRHLKERVASQEAACEKLRAVPLPLREPSRYPREKFQTRGVSMRPMNQGQLSIRVSNEGCIRQA